MSAVLTIMLCGSAEEIDKAKRLLENLPQVRRVDCIAENRKLRLLLSKNLHENSLIPLLSQSGICGFRLER